MKILFIADLHIKLGQKKVPKEWQRNRFMLLADELNKITADMVVIGGDLLDVANPSVEEVGLMYDFLNRLEHSGVIFPGNHEMTSKSKDCFRFIEPMLEALGFRVIRDFQSHEGIDYIPYNILHGNWKPTQNKLAFTHVRGEIPPHVEPEIDLRKFNTYDKVFAGDLHSTSNSQHNVLYPGSPFSTSFHRSIPAGSNGYFIIETSNGNHSWVELILPQLIRKTIHEEKDMIKTEFHHTIYELEGSIESLAKVGESDLLDKKLSKRNVVEATLDLNGSVEDELIEYLKVVEEVPSSDIPKYISVFKEATV